MSRSLVRSIGAHWLGTAINVVITIALTPFIVHALGSENYGMLVLLMSIAGHIAVLDCGMRFALVKYVAECRSTGKFNEVSSLLSSCVAALCIPATGLIVLSLFGWDFFQNVFGIALERQHKVQVLLFIFVIDGICELYSGIFGSALGGCERYDLINASNSVRLLLYAGLVVAALTSGGGILSVALIHFGCRTLHRITLLVLTFKNLPHCSLSPSLVRFKSLRMVIRYSGWAFLIVIAERIINQSQPWIIGSLESKYRIAIYALGAMLVEHVRQLGLQASTVLSTRLSSCLALKNAEQISALLERWFLYAPVAAGFFAVPFIFSGQDFISLWVGPAFAADANFLWIMSGSLMLVFPAFGFSAFLFASGQHRIVAIVQGIEAAASIVISLTLIGSFGLSGVAIGYMLSAALGTGIILPLASASHAGYGVIQYIRHLATSIGAALLPYAAVLIFLRSVFPIRAWHTFILVHLLAAVVCAALSYCFILKAEDKPYLARRLGIFKA